ncbi:hypothetical protein [Rhizobium leguminosarum]|uniref:hypothetical protein n=1 Tax=Rhizobium leguminosarum TaxID=384 RepID=UPI001C95E731|nr:hypothetical protein [Rhizobium leguminosarum]MBY5426995.1 hypothetical protein [Rhizobium leguminosarum]
MSIKDDGEITRDELKQLLKNDRVARLKYIAAAIDFYEAIGVKVDDATLKDFDEDAIKAVTGGGGGGTNVIAIF